MSCGRIPECNRLRSSGTHSQNVHAGEMIFVYHVVFGHSTRQVERATFKMSIYKLAYVPCTPCWQNIVPFIRCKLFGENGTIVVKCQRVRAAEIASPNRRQEPVWLIIWDVADCAGEPTARVNLLNSDANTCTGCYDRCESGVGWTSVKLEGAGAAAIAWDCIGLSTAFPDPNFQLGAHVRHVLNR